MSLIKFVFYSLVAYLVIRMFVRIFLTPKSPQQRPFQNTNQGRKQNNAHSENLEKPKFTIEAESVDYEIIDESKEKEK